MGAQQSRPPRHQLGLHPRSRRLDRGVEGGNRPGLTGNLDNGGVLAAGEIHEEFTGPTSHGDPSSRSEAPLSAILRLHAQAEGRHTPRLAVSEEGEHAPGHILKLPVRFPRRQAVCRRTSPVVKEELEPLKSWRSPESA